MTNRRNNLGKTLHQRHFVARGDMVIRQGESGDTAFLIQSGRVRVFAEHAGKTVELNTLEAGQIFGEMALIVDKPRTASVEALENTNLIVITRPMMIEKLAKTDPLIRALMPMLMDRIKKSNEFALNRFDNYDDLVRAAEAIHDNVKDKLAPNQQHSFEKAIRPKLDDFLKSIDDFKKLYTD